MVDKEKLDGHKKEFAKIIVKYKLHEEGKAHEIAQFLTKSGKGKVDSHEFALLFNMEKDDAETFLSFISKGIDFKEKHIDKKD